MSEPIFDPAAIFYYALEHAKEGRTAIVRSAMAKKVQTIFLCSLATINKWASPNESTKRRNPIESCGELFKLFFAHCRPAAFQVQSYFKELELRLMSEPLSPVESFQPRELIYDLRSALRLIEDLEIRRAVLPEYRDVMSELQAIVSTHNERYIRGAVAGTEEELPARPANVSGIFIPQRSQPEPAMPRAYNPNAWRSNRKG